MKFLSWIWLPPIGLMLLIAIVAIATGTDKKDHREMWPLFVWVAVDVPVTIVYVIARIWRRAVSDGRPDPRPYDAR